MYKKLKQQVDNMQLQKFNVTKEHLEKSHGMTYGQLRDILIRKGEIIEEIESEQIYILLLKTGKFGNAAVVAIGLKGTDIYMKAFAREGLVNQHTCERALRKICEELA